MVKGTERGGGEREEEENSIVNKGGEKRESEMGERDSWLGETREES